MEGKLIQVQLELIIMLILAMPIVLLMAAFIWYLNIEGFYTIVKPRFRKNIQYIKQHSYNRPGILRVYCLNNQASKKSIKPANL